MLIPCTQSAFAFFEYSYAIMKTCWLASPEERPTFDALRLQLGQMLERSNEQYGYLETTYVRVLDADHAETASTEQPVATTDASLSSPLPSPHVAEELSTEECRHTHAEKY